MRPEAAPELHRRLAAAGARKITFGRFSQILFEESRIEMLAADPQPQVGHRRAIVDGSEATVLASSQISTTRVNRRSPAATPPGPRGGTNARTKPTRAGPSLSSKAALVALNKGDLDTARDYFQRVIEVDDPTSQAESAQARAMLDALP